MKKLLTILCVVLLCSGVYAAVGDLHSSQAEFSITSNPNGNWSYHVGQAFGTYPYDTLSSNNTTTANFWMPPQGVGAPYSLIGNWGPGNEPNLVAGPLGGHSPFMTRYTVPADVNALEAGLSYCQMYEPARQMRLMIKKNGVTVAQMDSVPPPDNNGTNYTWTQFFPGQQKGFKFNVFQGDEIDFVVDGYGTNSLYPGVGTTSCFSSWVKEIEPLPTFMLTVNANPSHITSVSNIGISTQPKNEAIPLVASEYLGCQYGDGSDSRVYVFENWTGPVADPDSSSTTITSAGEDVVVTANYILASACGDVCHPSPIYDFNDDCINNLADFAIYAATWLECTQPVCID